jgi:hypothetical protein
MEGVKRILCSGGTLKWWFPRFLVQTNNYSLHFTALTFYWSNKTAECKIVPHCQGAHPEREDMFMPREAARSHNGRKVLMSRLSAGINPIICVQTITKLERERHSRSTQSPKLNVNLTLSRSRQITVTWNARRRFSHVPSAWYAILHLIKLRRGPKVSVGIWDACAFLTEIMIFTV